MPRGGRYRKRITIQEKTVTQNEFGEEEITWTTAASAWASSAPMNGREFIETGREVAELWTRFYIRYRADVTFTPAMRITDADSRIYDIEAVHNVSDRNQEILFLCRESVDA